MTRFNFYLISLLATGILAVTLCSVGQAVESGKRPSQKKGFCVVARPDGKWRDKVTALNAKWFYSWGSKKPDDMPPEVEFVPMMWGAFNPEKSKALKNLKEQQKQGEVKHLLGFNEPDQHNQSNLSVGRVLKLWPHLEATGLPLCSPGCVHPDRTWMKEFMAEVEKRQLRVDYVCVHSYGGPNAKALVQRLREVYKMYKRPIWITEFAVGDWKAKSIDKNKHSPEKIAMFMKELLPMLERLDFVERYAWFSASPDSAPLGTSALFNKDGSLTKLGKIYSSF